MKDDDFAIAGTLTKDYPTEQLIRGYAMMLVACATRYATLLRKSHLDGGARDTKAGMEHVTRKAFTEIVTDNLNALAALGPAYNFPGLDVDKWREVFTSRMVTQWKVAQAVDRQTPSDVEISDLVGGILESWGIEPDSRPNDVFAQALVKAGELNDADLEYAGGQYL